MSLRLHNLKSTSHKRKKRVGRGNASGHGTYSTRGLKGQRARSGGRAKARARATFLKPLPKLKGFKSPKAKPSVINLKALNRFFRDGDAITPELLREKGLVDTIESGVKILGQGELSLKSLIFRGCRVSQTAKIKIAKSGGKVI